MARPPSTEMFTFSTAVAVGMLVSALGSPAQGGPVPPAMRDADSFARKLDRIRAFALASPTLPQGARQTVLTEPELNAYLFWDLEDVVPTGITEPRLRLLEDGQVAGRAVIDLSAVRTQHERGWLDPLAYVGGEVPVTATGILRTRAGMATLELTSATVAGVNVPKSVLQELVTYYTRTPQTPRGVSLDDPFPLPAAISEIRVRPGEAVVVQ